MKAAGWDGPRFTDHEAARREGLPGALVPGILSQGYLAALIHRWAPDAFIENVDTVQIVRHIDPDAYPLLGCAP